MKKKFYAEHLREDHYDSWNRLVAASPHGSIYSTPEYLDALCEAAGGDFRILACFAGDQPVGGIGLYEVRSMLGRYVSNRLLLYYNGIVMKKGDSVRPYKIVSTGIDIMSALESALSRSGYSHVLLHNRSTLIDFRPLISRGWRAFPAYTYVVPLSDPDSVWDRIEQNLRRLIDRCEHCGVTVTADDDFNSFYDLHELTHHRKGAPLYLTRPAFRRYFERLKSRGLCNLYHARLPEGKSIATQLVLLGDHPVTHTVCAAADPEYLTIGSTPFLRWKVFEDLSRLGYEANDLTDAELNPVTRFKAQLGGNLERTTVLSRADSVVFSIGKSLQGMADRFRSAAKRALRSREGNENNG